MKADELPDFPIVLRHPLSGKFISYDEEGIVGNKLVERPEQATIFPMWGNSSQHIEDCKEQLCSIIEGLCEDFDEIQPLHVNISVQTQ